MDYAEGGTDADEYVVQYRDGKLVTNFDHSSDDNSTTDGSYTVGNSSDDGECEETESDLLSSSDEENSCSDLAFGERQTNSDDDDTNINEEEADSQFLNEALGRKTSMVHPAGVSHLPYTFAVPETYSAFIAIMDKYEVFEQLLVVDRMRKCNHASFTEENKDKLIRLFGFLLEYFGSMCLRTPVPISLLDKLTVHIYELASQFPQQTSVHSQSVIRKQHQRFSLYSRNRGQRGSWPFLDLVMYMKLLSVVYPTSDFRHEVITPAIVLASQIYANCAVTSQRDVAVGLMLTSIMVQYVSYSRTIMPECINFLSSLLYSASPLCSSTVTIGTSTCRSHLLKCKSQAAELRSHPVVPLNLNLVIARGVGNSVYNTDGFVLSALHSVLKLIGKFCDLYRHTESAASLFSHCCVIIKQIPYNDYPSDIQVLFKELNDQFKGLGTKNLEYLCRERRKPKALRMYDPIIENDFELGKKKVKNEVSAEKQKLRLQHKKELKSAIKELRKDRRFISNQLMVERLKRDKERQKKTNQILADLQGQQHDMNMYSKMNKLTQRKGKPNGRR